MTVSIHLFTNTRLSKVKNKNSLFQRKDFRSNLAKVRSVITTGVF